MYKLQQRNVKKRKISLSKVQ